MTAGRSDATEFVPSGLSQKVVGEIVLERRDALQALQEAIELADEGWAYASDYFVQKWDFIERRNRLAVAAGMSPLTFAQPLADAVADNEASDA